MRSRAAMSSPQLQQTVVTDTNLTPIVQIITWLTLTASVAIFLAHAGIYLYITRALSLEICAVFTAVVFSAGQSIAVSVQAADGFGKPFLSLSGDLRAREQKVSVHSLFIQVVCYAHNQRPNTLPLFSSSLPSLSLSSLSQLSSGISRPQSATTPSF